ncbi:MFS transporter [Leucobacter sp. UCMA 4100]|uniref:MFS transporter n=1 Tax=Leucobacter sp. UCMA 4100 TaxID=2810534 RepID=UPI0022EB4E43|nr:MFS transporter [Leucobacter sp. UCMA 4100]MDA3147769.1 MFS transporter [Leucobacter sp. UCMA 4100]
MKQNTTIRPWAALWTLVLGFFMILVDTTIVSVANPTIMRGLDTTMTATLWATSAYLLAYAVPLLITGRLGDRFGPRRVYLVGLATFTIASLMCGLAPNIETLIAARALQGIGASCMTPQTMSVITRIFPPNQRGSAMAIWGVTAGVAMLVGPILGGFLLGAVGWEWIFFINVPVGVVAFWLTMRNVPVLPTNAHRFDILGVVLSALGTFLVVFGIQEGETFDWGTMWGPVSIWGLIITGVIVLALFVVWQKVQRGEPLMPLIMFSDRNFSVGSIAIMLVGLTTTALALPLMFYLQLVRGLTPAQSALMLLPQAVLSIILARPIGKLVDRRDSRRVNTLGLTLQGIGIASYVPLMLGEGHIALLLIPSTILGVANSMMWGPLASITMYNVNPVHAGAASGVYNTSRQLGAVLGSAAMAMLMSARLSSKLGEDAGIGTETVGQLAEQFRDGYAEAMAQSILLPAVAIIIGAIVTLWFAPRPKEDAVTSV